MEELLMKYEINELKESKRQIESTIHKIRQTLSTFMKKDDIKRYQSQITLANRRIHAFEIAIDLIVHEIDAHESNDIQPNK